MEIFSSTGQKIGNYDVISLSPSSSLLERFSVIRDVSRPSSFGIGPAQSKTTEALEEMSLYHQNVSFHIRFTTSKHKLYRIY